MMNPAQVVESHVRETFSGTLTAIETAVQGATTGWPAGGVTDASRVRRDIRRALGASDVHQHLPTILESAIRELDASIPARPVAAPPYVVVTSEGVLLRATLADARLVITLQVVTREAGRYRRLGTLRVSARLV